MTNIIIRISQNHLLIMSGSIFNCCNNSDSVSYSQATVDSAVRNMNVYPSQKKSNYLHAPKSSLKTLASIRSLRNLENVNRSTLTYVPQPVAVIHEQPMRPVNTVTQKITYYQAPLYTPQKPQMYLVPCKRQMTALTSSSKERIRFSYSAEKVSENPEPSLPTDSKNRELTCSGIKLQTTPTRGEVRAERKEDVLNRSTAKKEVLEKTTDNRKSQVSETNFNPNKIKLGGSKFTILSEEEIQEVRPVDESQMKMEESAIIVNVFNPTKSQIQKWSVEPKVLRQSQV